MIDTTMTRFTPLEILFTANHSAELPVFLSPRQEVITWQNWLNRVVQWRQLLEQQPGERWALYHPCAGEFSACLFALLSLNKTVCLPGNRQPDFVTLLSTKVDGFVGDFNGVVNTLVRPKGKDSTEQPTAALHASSILRTIVLENQAPLIQVFTSGSSGEPQAIPKNLRQLSEEVKHLHMLWGDQFSTQPPQALVTGTVSHQHIYGLLFRVLWPLAAGWCSDTHPCEYFEELALRQIPGQHSEHSPRLLISSPTHLSRVPENLDAAATDGLNAVFSSGAPLLREHSLHAKKQLGVGVLEIFGSSETGGIAWRQQTDNATEAFWQAVPEIEIRLASENPDSADGNDPDCLEVRSSHLPDEHSWYSTSDRVRFADQTSFDEQKRFALLGRADRIVKIEGKRVSLDEMEKHLLQTPWVQQVHLLQLQGSRTEMAAVIVLSQEGKAALNAQGKRAVNLQLKDKLLSYFERPTLPRKWRYIDALPVNTQGKLQRLALLKLFENESLKLCGKESVPATNAEESKRDSRPVFPSIMSIDNAANQQTLQLQIPIDLLYFDGHFAQAPILPGVVQLHWAEHFARRAFTPTGEFLRLEVIKFQKVITPGDEVTLDLSYDPEKNKIVFAYHSSRGQHSSGRIVLGAAI